jgi:tryptophan synthase alpha chain
MSRYQLLQERKEQGQGVYLPYVLLGYPNAAETLNIAKILIDSGVHGLELGLPFRDPVADGPVIQDAANVALDNGFKTSHAVELVRKIRGLSDNIPLTIMAYYNMVMARGIEKFMQEFAEAGLDGLLVPDMPPERAEEIYGAAKKHGIALIFIASPHTTKERMEIIRRYVDGFVYVVTRAGITGEKEQYAANLPALFQTLKENLPLPAIAGFGISEPEQAKKMREAGADGVITGSKLIKLIGEGLDGKSLNLKALEEHTKAMLAVCR